MTREEANFIGAMNMCDEISNEAYKKIMCHCEEQEPCYVSKLTQKAYEDGKKDGYVQAKVEQEPIIDKIRAEIMQLDYNLESVDYDQNDMAMTEEVHMICQEEVLQIIDNYRSESEGKA